MRLDLVVLSHNLAFVLVKCSYVRTSNDYAKAQSIRLTYLRCLRLKMANFERFVWFCVYCHYTFYNRKEGVLKIAQN